MSTDKQNDLPLKKTLEREFDINVERRMRTAVFVQALYPELTLTEALKKLRNPKFIQKIIYILTNFEQEIRESTDTDLSDLMIRFDNVIEQKGDEDGPVEV